MPIRIVRLAWPGTTAYDTAWYRWELQVSGHPTQRFATLQEAREYAEIAHYTVKWTRDVQAGIYTGLTAADLDTVFLEDGDG